MAYSNYTVIDIETTGLNNRTDKIIEIAAVRVRKHEVADVFTELVNPGVPIDDEITKLTGITDLMVKDAPKIEAVLPAFFDFVGNDTVVGHNIRNFDIPFINAKAKKLNLQLGNRTVDTLHLSRYIYPEWEHHRLSDLVKNLGVTVGNAHRSLDDALATHKCYEKMPSAPSKPVIDYSKSTDTVSIAPPVKIKHFWLWVLGWIFIFPLPITILAVRKRDKGKLFTVLMFILAALSWAIYLPFAFGAV